MDGSCAGDGLVLESRLNLQYNDDNINNKAPDDYDDDMSMEHLWSNDWQEKVTSQFALIQLSE